jgi:hypothetical protein
MAYNEIPLLKIVSALLHDAEVRRRFNHDPMSVIKEFGLDAAPEEQLEALLTMNPNTIAAKLQDVVKKGELRKGEFPPPTEDFIAEDGQPEYPTPQPAVFRFRPREVSAMAVNSKSVHAFELVVYGKSFVDVELSLERVKPVKNPSDYAKLSIPTPLGTFRASVLRTVVSPPASEAVFKSGDEYRVRVVNQAGKSSWKDDVSPPADKTLKIIA